LNTHGYPVPAALFLGLTPFDTRSLIPNLSSPANRIAEEVREGNGRVRRDCCLKDKIADCKIKNAQAKW
jgi:hypothetical protein